MSLLLRFELRPMDGQYACVDWDHLGFGLMQTDYMYLMKCLKGEQFEHGRLSCYGNIELSPAAGVLNYGQGFFEGTKAWRRENGGIYLFWPQENAIRMQNGARRMCMPSPSVHQFLDAVKQTVLSNTRWIPPPGKGSLYIRPLLIGSGPVLGLSPASEYSFLVVEQHPSTCMLKMNSTEPQMVVLEVLKPISRARDRGFSDVLYLDSVNKRNIEEVSSCNIFVLKGNVLSTPALNGSILEGITRKSIIDIALNLGYTIEERCILIEQLNDADEVFCTGTAVGVVPVGSITYKGNRIEYETSGRLVSRKLYSELLGIQRGTEFWHHILELEKSPYGSPSPQSGEPKRSASYDSTGRLGMSSWPPHALHAFWRPTKELA